MIRSLFAKRSQLRSHSVPDGTRVYAVGDVHGRRDLLDQLLDQIRADLAAAPIQRPVVILLGDLIDRGPDSAGAVAAALDLERSDIETHFIQGNHEELLLLARDGDDEAVRLFARVGGRETLLSYGVDLATYESADFAEVSELARRHVPPEHIAFLARMTDMVEIGDYAFVHAGIMPGVALADQKPRHLRWIRREFLDHRGPHPRFIVHGHTITERVDARDNRLGIDTGAYESGVLTAVVLEADRRRFLQTPVG